MHTLSSRVAIAPLAAVLLLTPLPVKRGADANEFPQQQPQTPQQQPLRPLRKPDFILDRAPVANIRVLRTPDVTGQRVSEAKTILERAGFRAGPAIAEPTRGATPGTVVRQDPAAGTPNKPGAAITLWIATAPPRDDRRRDDVGPPIGPGTPPRGDGGIKPPDAPRLTVVPDLGGRSVPEALAILEKARLRPGGQRREESEAPPNTVVGQAPPARHRVPEGTPVNIVVATQILVEVPDLIGRPRPEALAQLERKRLGLGPQEREESEAVAGTVVNQSPGAGRRVPVGSPVALAIATPALVTVPDVRGTPEAPAIARLQSSRLRVGERRQQESEDVAGAIVAQRPAPGTRVPPGTPVNLLVAVPILVSVPDLTGRAADEASRLLRERQLSLGERHRQESDATPGSITRQSPRADVRVPRGTRIDVVVAAAPPPPPILLPRAPRRSDVTPPTPPPSPPAADPGPKPTPQPVPPSMAAPTPTPTPATPKTLTPSTPTPPPAPPQTGAPSIPPPPARRDTVPPVATTTPVAPPATIPPARQLDWLYPVALSVGLVLLLGGAGAALYRYSKRWSPSPPSVPAPTLEFAQRWDVGTVQIGPAGALSAGPGLRLVSGIESDAPYLDNEHIVKVVDTAGDRQ